MRHHAARTRLRDTFGKRSPSFSLTKMKTCWRRRRRPQAARASSIGCRTLDPHNHRQRFERYSRPRFRAGRTPLPGKAAPAGTIFRSFCRKRTGKARRKELLLRTDQHFPVKERRRSFPRADPLFIGRDQAREGGRRSGPRPASSGASSVSIRLNATSSCARHICDFISNISGKAIAARPHCKLIK